jgi:Phage terminase large subunit (GpA)
MEADAARGRGTCGFRLNALVSLHNARWGVLAAEFLAAKDDPSRLKPFVNTALAEPWRCQFLRSQHFVSVEIDGNLARGVP